MPETSQYMLLAYVAAWVLLCAVLFFTHRMVLKVRSRIESLEEKISK